MVGSTKYQFPVQDSVEKSNGVMGLQQHTFQQKSEVKTPSEGKGMPIFWKDTILWYTVQVRALLKESHA